MLATWLSKVPTVAFVFASSFSEAIATTPSSTVTSTSGYQRRRVTPVGTLDGKFEVVGLGGDVVRNLDFDSVHC